MPFLPLPLPLLLFVATAGPAASSASEGERRGAAEPSAPAIRIAVSDLDLDALEPRVQRIFSDSFLAELRKLERASVISMEEVRAMLDLEAQKQLVGCDEEESCLAEIAGAVGADILIVGGVAKLGEETVVSFKRIDQRSASVANQTNQRLAAAGGEELLAVIGPVVEALFPERALRPDLQRGVDPTMALRLNPPPLPTWTFWTGVGLSATLVAATGAAGAFWAFNQATYSELASSARGLPVSGALLVQQGGLVVGSEVAMWSLLGAAGAASALTALSALFTDWHGFRQATHEGGAQGADGSR